MSQVRVSPSPSPDQALMRDALTVLDNLEPQARRQNRRTALTRMVLAASQGQGHCHAELTVQQAVDALLAKQQDHPVIPVAPPVPSPTAWARVNKQVRSQLQKLRLSRNALIRSGRISLVLTIPSLLFWVPWLTIARWPFLQAVEHTRLFFTVLVTLGIFFGLVFRSACRRWNCAPCKSLEERKAHQIQCMSFWGLLISVFFFIGGVAAGFAAQQTNDVKEMINHDIPAVQVAMQKARLEFPQVTSFGAVVGLANQKIMADNSTRLRTVGAIVDAKKGVIQWEIDLNSRECQQLIHLPNTLEVSSINGLSVTNLATACPFVWTNEVVIRNRPGTL